MSCVICGSEESLSLETLSEKSLCFLTQTGTISTSPDTSKLICLQCVSSVTLMEQACRVQTVLADKFQRRLAHHSHLLDSVLHYLPRQSLYTSFTTTIFAARQLLCCSCSGYMLLSPFVILRHFNYNNCMILHLDRNPCGRNGTKSSSVTAQLLKSGNGINMHGSAVTAMDSLSEPDGMLLPLCY